MTMDHVDLVEGDSAWSVNEDEEDMAMSPEERKTLYNIAAQVSEIHQEWPDMKGEIIALRSDYRFLENRVSKELESRSHPYRSASVPPPRSPEELGLRRTGSGVNWSTTDADAQMVIEKFKEQEAQRMLAEARQEAAETALTKAREEADAAIQKSRHEAEERARQTDRLLKRVTIAVSLVVTIGGGIGWLLNHVLFK